MNKFITLTLLFLLVLPCGANAQKRTVAPKKRPPVSASPATPSSVNVEQPAQKLAEQLKLLSRFLFVYGKISAGFETSDDQARRGQLSENAQAEVKQNKVAVARNIGAFRVGLAKIEPDFKASPALRSFIPALAGISETIARAEQFASASQFDEAGKSLVTAAEKMADLLMRLK